MTTKLSSYRLASCSTLSELQARVDSAERDNGGYDHSVRICFLRNFTVEGVEPFLKYHCYHAGIRPELSFGNYDMIRQEILEETSHIYSRSPDIIVLSLLLEQLDPEYLGGEWRCDRIVRELESLFTSLAEKTSALLAVNTFVPPFESESGITNHHRATDKISEVAKVNQAVKAFVEGNSSRFLLMDWEQLVRIHGEEGSMDYRFWYMSKAPFKRQFLNSYAWEITKVVKALKGKAKKCLVLDCDNTLWGGIVGEDGIQGIKLDRNSYPGNVYYDFQRTILTLHERGVLIALCSKNNEEDVWEVLEAHPQSLLKREHITAWRINWDDKATNFRSLATELNLGLDSFVFVDDNPTECELVATTLPEVTVIQVPQKLYTYPGILLREGLFDTLTVSSEDRNRARMYQAEAQRKNAAEHYENIEQYLSSLQLVATIHEAKKEEVARIAQLTQKTNQFNLTTRRYSEGEISQFSMRQDSVVFSLSVTDKFGASGLTGVMIIVRDGGQARIDSFLLSCRILGRNLESVFLHHCLRSLAACWGVKEWLGEYVPTRKNRQVENFFERMGFVLIEESDTSKKYALNEDARHYSAVPYIKIEELANGKSGRGN